MSSSEFTVSSYSGASTCAAKATYDTHLSVEHSAGAPYDDPDTPPSALTALSRSASTASCPTATTTACVWVDSIKLT